MEAMLNNELRGFHTITSDLQKKYEGRYYELKTVRDSNWKKYRKRPKQLRHIN